jgi:tetratricopeptide (TPR) repeat protein
MELKLHNIHSGAIDSALQKAQQYRSLLEPEIAESICLDILNIDPDNQQAIVVYILALTDQLNQSERQSQIKEIERAIDKLVTEYQRFYYRGLLNERRARFMITQPMSRSFAYDYFYEALKSYKQAEAIRPENNDEAVLRWNSCIRTIQTEKLKPRQDSEDVLVDMES